MLKRHELGRLFYEAFGFRLVYIPFLTIAFFVASIAVPLLAWELRRRRLITIDSQRWLEATWLVATTFVATIGWAIWTIDFCDRMASAHAEPFGYGFFVLIALAILISSGVRQWRQNRCLGVKHLFTAFLKITLHFILFYVCLLGVVAIGYRLAFSNAGPMMPFYIPGWFFSAVLVIAIILYSVIAVLAIPAILRSPCKPW